MTLTHRLAVRPHPSVLSRGAARGGAPPSASRYVSFFRYASPSLYRRTSPASLALLRDRILSSWGPRALLGRVYVSREGVNAQLQVPLDAPPAAELAEALPEEMRRAMEEARAEPLDRALPPLFSTLHVRVRERLVSDPLCEEENEELMLSGDLLGRAGEEVEPAAWDEAMRDAAVTLDLRNDYEHEVGRFPGSRALGARTNRELLARLDEAVRDVAPGSSVLALCTGGVRCVKAGALLERRGFRVGRLRGGINAYAAHVRATGSPSRFLGRNFTFDRRLDGTEVTPHVMAGCEQCGDASTAAPYRNCAYRECPTLFRACGPCADLYAGGCCSAECAKAHAAGGPPPSPVRERRRLGDLVAAGERSLLSGPALCSPSAAEVPGVAAARAAAPPSGAHMMAREPVCSLLRTLAAATGARRALEIGTMTGQSALWIADAGVGEVVTVESDARAAEAARAAVACVPGVVVVRARALDYVAGLPHDARPFDFVFLDGAKGDYEPLVEALLGRGLVRRGALVVVDNTSGALPPRLGPVVRRFNRRVLDDPRVDVTALPREGVSVLRVL